MLRVDIIGIAQTRENFRKISGRIRKESVKMTLESARIFKRMVTRRLEVRTSTQGAGHNTKPLRQRLTIRKIIEGHRVFFTRGDEPRLPFIVEFGVPQSYPQDDNPFISYTGIPGLHGPIRPKFFWTKSIAEWKRTQKQLINKTAKKIFV